MNDYDSELIAGILRAEGYLPAPAEDQADLIVYNLDGSRILPPGNGGFFPT